MPPARHGSRRYGGNSDEIIRLTEDDVKLGVALPWSTYDKSGRLLLREGAVITSRNQLQVLLQLGMYRHRVVQDNKPEAPPREPPPNPFTVLAALLKRAQAQLQAIIDGRGGGSARDLAEEGVCRP